MRHNPLGVSLVTALACWVVWDEPGGSPSGPRDVRLSHGHSGDGNMVGTLQLVGWDGMGWGENEMGWDLIGWSGFDGI